MRNYLNVIVIFVFFYALSVNLYGIKNGIERDYYKTGQLRSAVSYQNNETNGPAKIFFRNGKLKREWFNKEGKIEGDLKEYYKNGALRFIASYEDNKRHGKRIAYYKSGKVYYEEVYKKGQIKSRKFYSKTGEILFEKEF